MCLEGKEFIPLESARRRSSVEQIKDRLWFVCGAESTMVVMEAGVDHGFEERSKERKVIL